MGKYDPHLWLAPMFPPCFPALYQSCSFSLLLPAFFSLLKCFTTFLLQFSPLCTKMNSREIVNFDRVWPWTSLRWAGDGAVHIPLPWLFLSFKEMVQLWFASTSHLQDSYSVRGTTSSCLYYRVWSEELKPAGTLTNGVCKIFCLISGGLWEHKKYKFWDAARSWKVKTDIFELFSFMVCGWNRRVKRASLTAVTFVSEWKCTNSLILDMD